MLDIVAMDDKAELPAQAESESSLCACGSGLLARSCCSFKMARQWAAQPTPENKTRLDALLDARKQTDRAAATVDFH